jgi:hypothetical protein
MLVLNEVTQSIAVERHHARFRNGKESGRDEEDEQGDEQRA